MNEQPACPNRRPAARRRRGFSLVEMLIVVSIISLLLGMLYSAIRAVQRYSRESITRGELKNIEAAWKQYFAHYHAWPTGTWTLAGATVLPEPVDEDLQYTLDVPLARMLEGQALTNADSVLNAEAIAFLELTRFDASGAPVNAWGSPKGTRYKVIFDVDGDNIVQPYTNANPLTRGPVFRVVAVWTEHPDTGRILGSWER